MSLVRFCRRPIEIQFHSRPDTQIIKRPLPGAARERDHKTIRRNRGAAFQVALLDDSSPTNNQFQATGFSQRRAMKLRREDDQFVVCARPVQSVNSVLCLARDYLSVEL